ncbi:GNAT family N-acetyltransferase [Duganella sp. HH101]|uniref:GNAT family N-acetyltransferase n=1 Tax=Duganella sp. HH101 TaxID=1781066 RepID=UPI0008736BD4|nr:GNAT family N-acetyltransferase [Duganella sp. HH101]OFA04441.1 acetyltransferase (GNAT) family protein [Duganella sp. HH101]
MIIRKAVITDLPRLAELFFQLGYPNTIADLEQRWDEFNSRDADCWVAVDDGAAIGVVTQNYVLPLNTTAQYAVISAFVVDEKIRRSGAGTALIRRAEQEAVARCCSHTELSSSMRRPLAHLFYEHYGFVEVPKRYVREYFARARENRQTPE